MTPWSDDNGNYHVLREVPGCESSKKYINLAHADRSRAATFPAKSVLLQLFCCKFGISSQAIVSAVYFGNRPMNCPHSTFLLPSAR